jgi:hypothetical protein
MREDCPGLTKIGEDWWTLAKIGEKWRRLAKINADWRTLARLAKIVEGGNQAKFVFLFVWWTVWSRGDIFRLFEFFIKIGSEFGMILCFILHKSLKIPMAKKYGTEIEKVSNRYAPKRCTLRQMREQETVFWNRYEDEYWVKNKWTKREKIWIGESENLTVSSPTRCLLKN